MKLLRLVGPGALLASALVFPLVVPDQTVTTIAFFVLVYAGAATSWNIFSGYTGYTSLGHVTFFGVGCYTLALLCQRWHIQGGWTPFLLLPLSGLVAGAFAVPLGWFALRARRHVFVVITLALFFIAQLLAFNLPSITNGSTGIYLPLPPWSADVFNLPFYYIALALLLFAIGVSWWVRHSKYGLGLLAIRDDEERAQGLGVKVGNYKLVAFVISAVFAGLAGALIAYYEGSVFPSFSFDPTYDPTVALAAFLGGVGTLSGPLLGALLIVSLQQSLTLLYGQHGLDLLLMGGLLLIVIVLLPEGIIPALGRRWKRWRSSRRAREQEEQERKAGPEARQDSLVSAEEGGEGIRH